MNKTSIFFFTVYLIIDRYQLSFSTVIVFHCAIFYCLRRHSRTEKGNTPKRKNLAQNDVGIITFTFMRNVTCVPQEQTLVRNSDMRQNKHFGITLSGQSYVGKNVRVNTIISSLAMFSHILDPQ